MFEAHKNIDVKSPFIAIICVLSFSLLSCSDTDGAHPETSTDESAGMILVKSTGSTATLGTDDTSAPLSARPAMKAAFTYDYALSKHEVTQGEYAKLAGGSVPDSLKDFPQTDVTYYDAVLFANLRSKAENIDTVYTYAAMTKNADGNCTSLEGLVTHLDRDGYRLPTEAEWTYAASLGWDPSGKAWTSDNSDYAAHAVCSTNADSAGFCDLAGNALEWTDDFLSNFKDTTVTDFAGAPDGGSVGERVVKGGSFRNAAANTKLYLRGDVYTVTGATRAAYVGFRLARGVVKNPTWVSAAGAVTSKISVIAGISTLRSLLGTYRAKLAFRDDATGNIAYIDYSSGTLAAKEISDTIDAYHPDISPDGSRVAFCTRPEGVSGTSAVYVRSLDSAGTGLVKLNVASAAIPRWRVSGTDTSIVYVTNAGDDSDLSAWKKLSTWEVPFADGKFGTPAKLLDGAFNAGVSYDGSLAVTGSKLLRASMNGKDSLWYAGEQACNASLSRDSVKRTLFLDFGGNAGRSFAGISYEAHARLLVADSSGKLAATYPAPTGYTFDHSEWVLGAKNFAVASLADANEAHSKLALVNLADSSVTTLAEGDELWHPCLWVNQVAVSTDTTQSSFVLDPDSAGAYDAESANNASKALRYKMEMLWRDADSAEILITGSSRPWAGVNPNLLTSGYAINMATAVNDIDISYMLAKNYIYLHWKKIKYIVVSLDIDILYHYNFWEDYYGNIPGYTYDSNHDFWPDIKPSVMYTAAVNAWGGDTTERNFLYERRGQYPNYGGNWGGSTPDILQDSLRTDGTDMDSIYINKVKMLIEMAEEHNVYVIGVIFPMSPAYKATGSFGRYGLRRSLATSIIQRIQNMETSYSNFRLMDENKMGDHDYADDKACDYDHLNDTGAEQLTGRLDSLLKTLK